MFSFFLPYKKKKGKKEESLVQTTLDSREMKIRIYSPEREGEEKKGEAIRLKRAEEIVDVGGGTRARFITAKKVLVLRQGRKLIFRAANMNTQGKKRGNGSFWKKCIHSKYFEFPLQGRAAQTVLCHTGTIQCVLYLALYSTTMAHCKCPPKKAKCILQ